MKTADLLANFRADMVDKEEPYLWSDEEVYGYMEQAQVEFCRRTGGIGDASTPAVTMLDITPADVMVATHPSILTIHDAYDQDDGRPIEVINYKDLTRRGERLRAQPGTIRSLIIGMEPNKARAQPLVAETVSLQLLVDRLPLVKIDTTGTQDFEVDDQHLPTLLLWMKSLAYQKQDAETFDRSRAVDFEARFTAKTDTAKVEKERALHKTRVVQYGGI